MPTSERRRRLTAPAVTLLLAAILLFGVAAVLYGTERHAYARDALPPSQVTVSEGQTYRISIHGGVQTLAARNLKASGLQCEWSSPGAGSQLLSLDAESEDSKATDVIASFPAPVSGPIHVDCLGLGPVFVDDADSSPFDLAGLCLLLGMIAFGVGLLILATPRMRFASGPGASAGSRGDEEIERLVHVVHVRSEDDEVTDRDGGDVGP